MDAPVVNPPTPYTTLIPGGFFPGKMIRIQGFVPMHAQRFDINLQTGAGGEIAGEDVAIHASVRLSEGYIARNSFQGNCWQEELGEGGLPIMLGQRFELLLLCESYEYKIAVNGQHFCGFPARVPFHRITHLMIEGDVQIEVIAWEGSPASAPPPQYNSAVPPPQYTPQQTFMQQAAPNPPPGAKSIPMPSLPVSGLPPSALSYGPSSALYPNLDPHFHQGQGITPPFGGHPPHTGPHPGGIIPPNIPQSMPQPTNPLSYPESAHKPFPPPGVPHAKIPGYPSHHNILTNTAHLSEKDKKKIAKAEYKAEKKLFKAQRRAEKKAAKAERKAMKKHGIPTSAVVGAGVGAVGAATLAYAMTHHGRRSSCSSSSSSSSSSSD